MNPFGGGANPFGGTATGANPFAAATPVAASPFGGGATGANPFGGAPAASPFGGAAAPAASPFGGAGAAPAASPFGGAAVASPFAGGGTAAFATPTSSAGRLGTGDPKFRPTKVSNGNDRYVNLCFLSEYKRKSMEELRAEDYIKAGKLTVPGMTAGTTSPFGAGGGAATSPFAGGGAAANPFGGAGTAAAANPFGGGATAAAANPFGGGTAAAANPFGGGGTAAAANPFGGGTAAAANPFGGGGTAAAANPFGGGGTAAAANPFGGGGTAAAANPFGGGGTAAAANPFGGGTAAAANPFGGGGTAAAANPFAAGGTAAAANPFGGGGTAAAANPFGGTTTTSPNPFGGTGTTGAANPFGTAAAANPFGGSTTTSPNPFAATGTAGGANPFAATTGGANPFGATTGGANPFGATTTGAANPFSSPTAANGGGMNPQAMAQMMAYMVALVQQTQANSGTASANAAVSAAAAKAAAAAPAPDTPEDKWLKSTFAAELSTYAPKGSASAGANNDRSLSRSLGGHEARLRPHYAVTPRSSIRATTSSQPSSMSVYDSSGIHASPSLAASIFESRSDPKRLEIRSVATPDADNLVALALRDRLSTVRRGAGSDNVSRAPTTPVVGVRTVASDGRAADGTRRNNEATAPTTDAEAQPDGPPAPWQQVPQCKRRDYYTEPSLAHLSRMRSDELASVPNFTVGRIGVGSVRFLGNIDVRGIDLDVLVHIEPKEITVYPDDDDKPAQGQQLNVPSEVTLLKCWPLDRETGEPLLTQKRLAAYRRKMQRIPDTTFISYTEADGAWTFRVPHWTKYGLADGADDDDSEDDGAGTRGARRGQRESTRAAKGKGPALSDRSRRSGRRHRRHQQKGASAAGHSLRNTSTPASLRSTVDQVHEDYQSLSDDDDVILAARSSRHRDATLDRELAEQYGRYRGGPESDSEEHDGSGYSHGEESITTSSSSSEEDYVLQLGTRPGAQPHTEPGLRDLGIRPLPPAADHAVTSLFDPTAHARHYFGAIAGTNEGRPAPDEQGHGGTYHDEDYDDEEEEEDYDEEEGEEDDEEAGGSSYGEDNHSLDDSYSDGDQDEGQRQEDGASGSELSGDNRSNSDEEPEFDLVIPWQHVDSSRIQTMKSLLQSEWEQGRAGDESHVMVDTGPSSWGSQSFGAMNASMVHANDSAPLHGALARPLLSTGLFPKHTLLRRGRMGSPSMHSPSAGSLATPLDTSMNESLLGDSMMLVEPVGSTSSTAAQLLPVKLAAPSCMVDPTWTPPQPGAPPPGESLLVADAQPPWHAFHRMRMGRSFRVGWGPGGVLVHAGRTIHVVQSVDDPSYDEDEADGVYDADDDGATVGTVRLERVRVGRAPNRAWLRSHMTHLWPLLQSHLDASADHAARAMAVERHVQECAQSDALAVSRLSADVDADEGATMEDRESWVRSRHNAAIWRLLLALWTTAPSDLPQYEHDRARRALLSSWLEEQVADRVQAAVDATQVPPDADGETRETATLERVFHLLTGNRVTEATRVCIEARDFRLATLIAQSGTPALRRSMDAQLSAWRKQWGNVTDYIHPLRLRLYQVLAGSVKDNPTLYSCLGWKRRFGLYLWHVTASTSPLAEAVASFDRKFFRRPAVDHGDEGAEDERISPALPPYLEEEDLDEFAQGTVTSLMYDDQDLDDWKLPWDMAARLIYVHANRCPLHLALDPSGYTRDACDAGLAWHVYLVLTMCQDGCPTDKRAEYHLVHAYADQLEAHGAWAWAVYVLLVCSLPMAQKRYAVCSVISRNVGGNAHEDSEQLHMLLQHEGFLEAASAAEQGEQHPWAWVYQHVRRAQAWALNCSVVHRSSIEKGIALAQASDWVESHRFIVHHLAGDVVFAGIADPQNVLVDQLHTLLHVLKPHLKDTNEWSLGGGMYGDFLQLLLLYRNPGFRGNALVWPPRQDLERCFDLVDRLYNSYTPSGAGVLARAHARCASAKQREVVQAMILFVTQCSRWLHSLAARESTAKTPAAVHKYVHMLPPVHGYAAVKQLASDYLACRDAHTDAVHA